MDGGGEDRGADGETGRELPAAAIRALAEADERRRAMDARPSLPPEVNGRDGPGAGALWGLGTQGNRGRLLSATWLDPVNSFL